MEGKFDSFHLLPTEKKSAILNAAFEEFGEKGFKRASTNAIVEKAGISKGTLFYYFNSKRELFDFLCEYAMEFASNTYLEMFSPNTGDFIERFRMFTEIKRRAMMEYPHLIRFVEGLYQEENAEYIEDYLKSIKEIREKLMEGLYGNLDISLFREDITSGDVIKYIRWMMESYENDVVARFKRGVMDFSNEEVLANEWRVFYAFLDDVRKIFYRG